MTPAEARNMVQETLSGIVPESDVGSLRPDDRFRDVLEIDSLDFLNFLETLGDRAGIRIDDEDTPHLTTVSGCVKLLVARTS